MMPKQGTLPHTRNSNESKRRRRLTTPALVPWLAAATRVALGGYITKRRGCRHQNQAARRRRRQRRRCGGCAQAAFCGAAAAKRVLQGRHVAGSEFMHHAASTFTVSTKNESYNYMSGSLQKQAFSSLVFFLTTPRDIHIEYSKQLSQFFRMYYRHSIKVVR